jgi:dsRNA-specific ribonuclease
MSAMCCELIEYALEHGDEYKGTITKQEIKQNTVEALLGGAVLDDQRMQKLLKLLDALN